MKIRQAKKIVKRNPNDHCHPKRSHHATDPYLLNGIGYSPSTPSRAIYPRGTFYKAQFVVERRKQK